MLLKDIEKFAAELAGQSQTNRIQPEWALDSSLVGIRMFDAPIIGVADASDELFGVYKRPGVVGPHFRAPKEWLPEAKSVVAFFLPFSEEVRVSNRDGSEPSKLWLHSRYEGQRFVKEMCLEIAEFLRGNGGRALAPTFTDAFASVESVDDNVFTSNWSERHIAYAAGLGTFGLSKGLITKKGVAGRYGSVVTSLEIDPTPREYTGLYDYCINCGACARRCPANAIDSSEKKHIPCKIYVSGTAERYAPRYGCGKCQVGVPCENAAPGAPRTL